jgi:hypothetical protein
MTVIQPFERPITGQAEQARAERIAYLHHFADWLTAHPEVPVPTQVIAQHFVTDVDEADEYTRIMGALSIMLKLNMQASEGLTTVQGEVDICTQRQHGISVVYRVAAMKDDQPVRRYIPPNGV